MPTQLERVRAILKKQGYITRYSTVNHAGNNILNLGQSIMTLRQEGMNIIGVKGKDITNYQGKDKIKNAKNYHYILKRRCVENKDGSVTLK